MMAVARRIHKTPILRLEVLDFGREVEMEPHESGVFCTFVSPVVGSTCSSSPFLPMNGSCYQLFCFFNVRDFCLYLITSSKGISRKPFSICLMRVLHMENGVEIADEEQVNWEWLEQGQVPNSLIFMDRICWMMIQDHWLCCKSG